MIEINNFQISKDFNLREFQCPCCMCVKISADLVRALQKMRDEWGKAIMITSGYRCSPYNKAVGGIPNSLHLRGLAVDIVAEEGLLPLIKKYFRKVYHNVKRHYLHLEI